MATTTPMTEPASEAQTAPITASGNQADAVVCLPPMSASSTDAMFSAVATAFPEKSVLIATVDHFDSNTSFRNLRSVTYETPRTESGWILTASDFIAAGSVAKKFDAKSVLLLGDEAVTPTLLRSLHEASLSGADLVYPSLAVEPEEGLVNAALVYPLTRALFAADVRFPLPVNLAMSRRAADRFATVAQRLTGTGGTSPTLWTVPEAAMAGYTIRQVETSDSLLPHRDDADFGSLFTSVIGSLFVDLELKAPFWQRARTFTPAPPARRDDPPLDPASISPEIRPMVESFRLAYANLHEIWALVLPPQTLLALKRLSVAEPETFAIAPSVWARIAYDFALAFHLRAINRGHLLGALTPLYLAWVASYLRAVADDPLRASHLREETAAAFETEKSYFVSRWRWPDRFNP